MTVCLFLSVFCCKSLCVCVYVCQSKRERESERV